LALATQDKLTGAFNRHKWKEQIQLQLDLVTQLKPRIRSTDMQFRPGGVSGQSTGA